MQPFTMCCNALLHSYEGEFWRQNLKDPRDMKTESFLLADLTISERCAARSRPPVRSARSVECTISTCSNAETSGPEQVPSAPNFPPSEIVVFKNPRFPDRLSRRQIDNFVHMILQEQSSGPGLLRHSLRQRSSPQCVLLRFVALCCFTTEHLFFISLYVHAHGFLIFS